MRWLLLLVTASCAARQAAVEPKMNDACARPSATGARAIAHVSVSDDFDGKFPWGFGFTVFEDETVTARVLMNQTIERKVGATRPGGLAVLHRQFGRAPFATYDARREPSNASAPRTWMCWAGDGSKRTADSTDPQYYRAAMRAADAVGIAKWLNDTQLKLLPVPTREQPSLRPDQLAYDDSASNTVLP
ncbi:MAG: hypothetical protein JNK82_37870 [Myxococcaceae bacterium]|nr:hypothetical protein [Myxococcaceae bacterium]